MTDHIMQEILANEYRRHRRNIELIASENFVSKEVLQMLGSIVANKLAEGYAGNRYNEGCQYVDQAEEIAINRLKQLFDCKYANVQPHSGSQANQAVFLALLNPGDTFMAMSSDAGGHLTHGNSINMSGKWFNAVHYGVNKETDLIDYEEVERLALQCQPKLIIVGHSSYSRNIDFKEFKRIANKVGAYFLADIAHTAGIIAAGYGQNPLHYADIVTSTTHKTMRGPRGGMIMSNREDLFEQLDSALFPGIQSATLMNIIMAKAVTFSKALSEDFKKYIGNVLLNAKIIAKVLQTRGYKLLADGTDNHIIMIDLRNSNINGKLASEKLAIAGITCNKNVIPFDSRPINLTSGIRLGTPACTTRGFGIDECKQIANIVADVLDEAQNTNGEKDNVAIDSAQKVEAMASKFALF
ncbi:Serine hydroxymethyltransferase [Pseudolycoriella hygida]|uniref:Serine hydroxymethyltransferase n=1 Tax=Pseudolycoriella hygida TaxID=35572 RepID=A0A9Q0S693_9DIPT|nr:Serine hydroxymethyltransferase [Pseudolycoriella hygida]